MPYDFYDYFLVQRDDENFTEITNIIRQKLWRDTYDVVEAQQWLSMEERIMLKLYYNLRNT